jgi:hypothetical protein
LLYQIISQTLELASVIGLLIKHLTVGHLVDALINDVTLLVEL